MASGTLAPNPIFRPLNATGGIIPGAKLYTYRSGGGSTPATTWSDQGLTTPNAWPTVLSAEGLAILFLDEGGYKFDLKYPDGSQVEGYPVDGILSVSGNIGAEVAFIGGSKASPITDVTFPVGGTYDKLHDGTSLWAIDAGDVAGEFQLEVFLKTDGSAVLSAELVNMDDAPNTAVATVGGSSATGTRLRSGNISLANPGSTKNYGIKVSVSEASGYLWGARIVRV